MGQRTRKTPGPSAWTVDAWKCELKFQKMEGWKSFLFQWDIQSDWSAGLIWDLFAFMDRSFLHLIPFFVLLLYLLLACFFIFSTSLIYLSNRVCCFLSELLIFLLLHTFFHPFQTTKMSPLMSLRQPAPTLKSCGNLEPKLLKAFNTATVCAVSILLIFSDPVPFGSSQNRVSRLKL